MIQEIIAQLNYAKLNGYKPSYLIMSKGNYSKYSKKIKPYRMVNRLRKMPQLPPFKCDVFI
jgi:hypothetical protein